MPTPRQRLAAAVIAGKLYAVGGDDAGGTLDTLEIFTPVVTAIGLTIDEVETLVNSDLLNQGQGNAL
ncbi:kelch motif-containing protein, partial [Nitrospinae bacterium AH_259_B05_G02_I21]|nr:kelch motif-containing protein [Nitrospinae bacterium AH_259_B05_G02_I21]